MAADAAAALLVIQHADTCPLGYFQAWLADAGCTLDVRHGDRGEPIPSAVEGFDGLLVLGGPMGAGDDETHSWLGPTKRLIAAAVENSSPFLGICLGHQLASAALGGTVVRNRHGRAAGLTPVTLTTAGRADRLLGVSAPGSRAVQWNSDAVDGVPAGAEVLATCPDGTPQAIRFGPLAWGVQFHPEASAAIFRSWITDGDGKPGDSLAGQALRDIAAAEDELQRAWRPFAERFAAICREAAVGADPDAPVGGFR